MSFEIKYRDAAGRICKFHTKHGTVNTPNLMPVINPNKMIITPKEMKKLFGTEIIITNSYIIKKDEKLRKIALDKGVHDLVDFDGAIMTDSGTFQSYVYGNVKLDPIEIVHFQRQIGSDIGTILDIFGTPDQTKKEAEKGLNETIKRAEESIKIKGEMLLACPVQGSIYPDLRKNCAEKLSKLNADFFPIGGVVPLMENQMYSNLISCLISSKKGLDPSKPVHLFGAGHPLIFPIAVALGCDFFDSSAYAKYANNGRMIFPWGTGKLEELYELSCSCPACSDYTLNELKKLDENSKKKELAKHNLYISFSELKRIRNAISEGSLLDLVERRATSNPYLMHAMKILRKQENKEWLERYEPVSKKRALFYTGSQTIHRPIFFRCYKKIFKNYSESNKKLFVFNEVKKPYSSYYLNEIEKIINQDKDANIIIKSNIGPVPIELDEMYPFAQFIFPEETDLDTKAEVSKLFDLFCDGKNVIFYDKINIRRSKKQNIESTFDIKKISSVSNMQFGNGIGEILDKHEIKIKKSKKTGKIRNVYLNNKHILSMRASDGLFTLKIEGAKLLHKNFRFPKLRVIINSEAVPFVKKGNSVFSKFVIDCDPDLRPFDECIVVDEKDKLLAVGRCILNRDEMMHFNYGIAVKTRENIS
jgi:7-cyano-7-deazaguanine tRNA-ribosyltransferase